MPSCVGPTSSTRTPGPSAVASIRVEVVHALADAQTLIALELEAPATVADALAAAVEAGRLPADVARQPVGIFGKRVERSQALAAGDRVELYRPLPADPKEQRRARARDARAKP
jgi:uncharacterized protein